MKRADSSYTANTRGYMIAYKSQNIGGAGIQGKFKGRGKAVQQQIESYKHQAQATIENIMQGMGAPYMMKEIAKIDNA